VSSHIATLAARTKAIAPPAGSISMAEAARLFRQSPVTLTKWALYGAGGARLDSFLSNGRRFTTREAIDRFIASRHGRYGPTPANNPRWLDAEFHSALRAVDASLCWLADAERAASEKRRRKEAITAAERIHGADVVQCLAASLDRCDAWPCDDELAEDLIDEGRRALARVLTVAGCDDLSRLPRMVAAAWPRIAEKTAGIQFGATQRRKRRGRLFRTSQPTPFQSRRPTAEEATRRPLGLWLEIGRRRVLRREGHAAEIPLSPLQFAAVGKLLDAARLDLPCPGETLREAWDGAGIVDMPKIDAFKKQLRQLRDLLAGVGVTFTLGRFLGYFLEPSSPREPVRPAGGLVADEKPAAVDLQVFFAAARRAAVDRAASDARAMLATPCRVRLAFFDLSIDPVSGTVYHAGNLPIRLNRTRLELLRILADAEGRFVGVEDLNAAWLVNGLAAPSKGTMVAQCRILASELAAIGLTVQSNRNGRRLVEVHPEAVGGR
jgi:hypothetical protein